MSSSLLTPELLRRLEQFQLLAARRAKSSAKGERRSRARGQSVEFADYRNYVHGDDFRYLDWNLYGRLERLFLKLYEEERELPVRRIGAGPRAPVFAFESELQLWCQQFPTDHNNESRNQATSPSPSPSPSI